MKSIFKALVFVATLLPTTPAAAIIVATSQDLTTTLAAGRYSGVGSLGFMNSDGSMSHGCTGSLVSNNVVLTATHCLSDISSLRFVLPAAGDYNQSGGAIYTFKSSAAIESIYGGGSDLAVATLNEVVTDHEIYELYTDHDELGSEFTLVGAGMIGTFESGADYTIDDERLRAGYNRFDATDADFERYYAGLYGQTPPENVGEDQLLYDNDTGTEQDDTFGKVFGIHDTGIFHDGKLVEAGTIYGDSGGPDFLRGKIAGIHSSGASSGFFQKDGENSCGTPGSLDRVVPGPFGCTDGSAGDFGVSMRVSFYADAVKSYISASAVPEPSTWAMMITGFFVAGMMQRRTSRKLGRVRSSLV